MSPISRARRFICLSRYNPPAGIFATRQINAAAPIKARQALEVRVGRISTAGNPDLPPSTPRLAAEWRSAVAGVKLAAILKALNRPLASIVPCSMRSWRPVTL